MRIDGQWTYGDDGEVCPIVAADVVAPHGRIERAEFLIDTGADNTALRAELIRTLGLTVVPSTLTVSGVGGAAPVAAVDVEICFPRPSGAPVVFRGTFLAFTEHESLAQSVLGRDILDLFAVIIDRPGDTIALLRDNHRYRIEP